MDIRQIGLFGRRGSRSPPCLLLILFQFGDQKGARKMKNAMQYPFAYSKDHSSYTYFTDDGTRVVLITGQDGVTEDWIVFLKNEHISEINMLRKGRGKGEGKNKLLSLTRFETESSDKADVLIDPNANIEANYLAGVERIERREAIQKAMASLSPEQRELLIKVTVKRVPIKAIASSLGIAYQSVQDRVRAAKRKFEKNLQI